MKNSYDKSVPRRAGDNRDGKVAFHEFLYPSNDQETMSTIVLMDEVLCQDEPTFKRVLLNMRQGTVEDGDVDFLISREQENLP